MVDAPTPEPASLRFLLSQNIGERPAHGRVRGRHSRAGQRLRGRERSHQRSGGQALRRKSQNGILVRLSLLLFLSNAPQPPLSDCMARTQAFARSIEASNCVSPGRCFRKWANTTGHRGVVNVRIGGILMLKTPQPPGLAVGTVTCQSPNVSASLLNSHRSACCMGSDCCTWKPQSVNASRAQHGIPDRGLAGLNMQAAVAFIRPVLIKSGQPSRKHRM